MILWVFLLIISSSSQQIQQNIFKPQTMEEKHPIHEKKALMNQSFIINYDRVNFQSSFKLYSQKGEQSIKNAYNPKQYDNQFSDCILYGTDLNFQVKQEIFIQYPITYKLLEGQKHEQKINELYMITKESQLVKLQLRKKNNEKEQNLTELKIAYRKQLPQQVSLNKEGQIVKLFTVNKQLFMVTTSSLYQIKNGQFQQIWGFHNDEMSRVIDGGKYDENGKKIWIAFSSKIKLYKLTDDRVKFIESISTGNSEPLIDVIYENYCFFILHPSTLIIKSVKKYPILNAQFNLPAQCSQMKHLLTTFHILCEYKKIPFIMELFVLGEKAILNRYYTQNDVEGLRNVFAIGQGKMALVGDSEVLIQGFGVNRHVLEDMGKQQLQGRYLFLNGLQIINIPSLSSKLQTHFFIIYEGKIVHATIIQNPPQLFCQFENNQPNQIYSLLIVFNSTYCTNAERVQQELYGTIETLCTIYYPVKIGTTEGAYEAKTAVLILIMVVVVIMVVSLFCAGWGFKRIGKQSFNMGQIRKSIVKIKKRIEEKELKQI